MASRVSKHLDWLNRWYAAQTSQRGQGHHFEIEAMPDGEWHVRVPLDQAVLAAKPFSPVSRKRTDDDWVHCWVEGQDFQAAAGPRNLSEALHILRTWSEKPAGESSGDKAA